MKTARMQQSGALPMGVTTKDIANKIRIIALGCESKDVMSCRFGNEFAGRVEAYLRNVLNEVKDEG